MEGARKTPRRSSRRRRNLEDKQSINSPVMEGTRGSGLYEGERKDEQPNNELSVVEILSR